MTDGIRGIPDVERVPPGLMRCPTCERPPLLEYLRTRTPMATPARYCPRCNGIFAEPPVLSGGVNAHASEHPAFGPGPLPLTCPACGKPLGAGDRCAGCSHARPATSCPACSATMQRETLNAVTFDDCPDCGALWFDAGELRAALGNTGTAPPSLSTAMASRIGAENKAMTDGLLGRGHDDRSDSGYGLAAELLLRLLVGRFGGFL